MPSRHSGADRRPAPTPKSMPMPTPTRDPYPALAANRERLSFIEREILPSYLYNLAT
jgi:hypothetical protein